MNFQIFENGDGSTDIRKTFSFDGTGTFFEDGEGGGGTDPVLGCTDASACNYSADATETTALACNWMSAAYVAVTALPMALATVKATARRVTTATATA